MRNYPGNYDYGLYRSACFKSSSSSSTSSSQETNQFDERVAAQDDAIVIQLDAGASIEVVDPGIIALGETVLGGFERALESTLGFAKDQNEKGLALVSETLEASRGEEAKSLKDVLIFGGVVTAVVAGATVAAARLK